MWPVYTRTTLIERFSDDGFISAHGWMISTEIASSGLANCSFSKLGIGSFFAEQAPWAAAAGLSDVIYCLRSSQCSIGQARADVDFWQKQSLSRRVC